MEYGTGAIFGCPAHDQRDLDFARKYGLPVIPVVLPPGEDPAIFAGRRHRLCRGRHRVQFRFPERAVGRRGEARGRRAAGAARARRAHDRLPAARLGRVAAALLGLPDPGHPLPGLRHRAGAGGRSAGRTAAGCQLRPAGQPARPSPDLEARRLPVLQQPGDARDRHVRHVLRIVVVFPALLLGARAGRVRPRRGRILDAGRPVYRRRRARRAAPAVFAVFHAGAEAAAAISISTSRSPACSRRAWYCTRPIRTATANGCSRRRSTTTDDGRLTDAAGRPVTVGRLEKMSKSKKNVVDLDDIVDTYGADTARLYLLSDSPPERDLEWTEAGIDGAWRYVNRLWRLVSEPRCRIAAGGDARCPADLSPGARRAAPHDPQDDRSGHRRSRKIPLQPRRRAHPRADQCAGGHPGRRAGRRRGAARGARSRDAADRSDDAASRRGDVADAGPRRS